MDWFVKEIIGLFVWLVANAVYLGSVRTGRKGIRRFVAFWMGLPGTLVTLVVVKEGSQPDLAPPPDDEDALLEDIRRSRAIQAGPQEDQSRETEEGP